MIIWLALICIHSTADDKIAYTELMEIINWFMFSFLILGYIEDEEKGLSFRMFDRMEWNIFIEVRSKLNIFVYFCNT